MMIRVALAGNPNVGKSVIFNNLTGSHQRIGNWPGKTVEKKEGIFRYDSEEIYVIDLPGIYSLTPYSVEELIARNYIIEERPDIVVVIIDASNIERNLYLLLQILELEVKIVVALNKTDLARSSNIHIDVKKLESMLGVPVIPMVAPKKLGMGELCRKILEVAKSERQRV
ncbi:MAG: ferrous iron transporter B, partial [Thermoprotei archaeon]